ncbi:hypothetical protein SEA_RUBYRALPH_86 [Microbacterium phage RubyRalph]|nr:hypothetical protein SEA_RUBYRALPH_86 [Microbacterium phage RubyRalph]
MGMNGMVNASLEDRAAREYMEITTYRAQHPGVDIEDPKALAIAVATETTRSVVGYILMSLVRDNDSIRVQRIVDRAAQSVGITSVSANHWSTSPEGNTYG